MNDKMKEGKIMQLSDLKEGLFGYRKDSVYQYIAALNESFAQKLLEAEKRAEDEIARWKKANAELEEALAERKKESEAYKDIQFSISDSIINAQNYAEQLKQETQQKEQLLRGEMEEQIARRQRQLEQHAVQVEEQIAQRQQQLEQYAARVEAFRGQLKALLQSIDGMLEQKQREAGDIVPEEPREQVVAQQEKESEEESRGVARSVNMALFQLENER